jgi:hypothetical protein
MQSVSDAAKDMCIPMNTAQEVELNVHGQEPVQMALGFRETSTVLIKKTISNPQGLSGPEDSRVAQQPTSLKHL